MLSENDQLTIRALREFSTPILEDVNPHRINGDGRNVVIMCADGHQSHDQISAHTRFIQRRNHSEHCCHSLMLNGGALLLSPEFGKHAHLPFYQRIPRALWLFLVRRVLLWQIEQSLVLKDANTVALYVHCPCGAAKLQNLSFTNVLDRLFEARDVVKQRFASRENFKVACFVQIDYGTDRKRSYFISRTRWVKWRNDPPTLIYKDPPVVVTE